MSAHTRSRDLVGVPRRRIIEVGRELIAAKAEAAHGDRMPWLEREFGWPDEMHAQVRTRRRGLSRFQLL
jgi:hypothetical protein